MKKSYPDPLRDLGEKTALSAPYRIILYAFFLCGAITGNCTAFALAPSSLAKFCSLSVGGATIGGTYSNFALSACRSFKCSVLLLLLGFFILGIFLIPLAAAAKGFGLGLCVSCFYRAAGVRGLGAAAVCLLVQNVFTLPLFFIFASQAAVFSKNMLLSFAKSRKISADPPPYYFSLFGICAASGLLSQLFELCAVPRLLSALCAH